MIAVILAAGKGTRLMPYTRLVPKPLVPISLDDKKRFITIIEKIILQLVLAGIKKIIIVVNYKGDMIKNYVGDGSNYGAAIEYRVQKVLDGNAGAFYQAQDLIEEDVLVTDCDNFFFDNQVFQKIADEFYSKKSDLTVGVSYVKNYKKYAIIKTKHKKPVDIIEKPEDQEFGNLAKSGLLILKKEIALLNKKISKINNEYTTTQIIKYCLENGYDVNLFNLKFSDIGTWEEYIALFKKNIS